MTQCFLPDQNKNQSVSLFNFKEVGKVPRVTAFIHHHHHPPPEYKNPIKCTPKLIINLTPIVSSSAHQYVAVLFEVHVPEHRAVY